jgi:nitroimidazol reductase NimA-like FMN-containing flavoprotein (pyridoxamine 5'-phosphate oxidase superfamily)
MREFSLTEDAGADKPRRSAPAPMDARVIRFDRPRDRLARGALDSAARTEGSAVRMSLADARVHRFLATKDVVVLAIVQPDGAPLAMPMWFVHDPAALAMVSVADTPKIRHLHRDPRVSVVAEGGSSGHIEGVAVHGRAEFLSEGPERRALVERFLEKYHPYLERRWGGRALPADRAMFRIDPSRVRAWGLD